MLENKHGGLENCVTQDQKSCLEVTACQKENSVVTRCDRRRVEECKIGASEGLPGPAR